MAAPTSAYFPIDFKFRGSNNVEMTVNPAKAQADKATLMARFYLDDVICFQANVGGVLYHGFWGVVLPSGFNYNHHKTTRLLEINGPKPGQVLRTFNDAGLNTLGDVTDLPAVELNNVETVQVKSFTSKSAFYITGAYGVEVNVNSSGWLKIQFGTQAANNTLATALTNIAEYLEFLDVVQIRAYHENAEGIYRSAISANVFTVEAAPVSFKFNNLYASSANASGTTTTYYYQVAGIIGGSLYNDALGVVNASLGYYVGGGKWYQVQSSGGGNIILISGNAVNGQWPAGDPANYTTRTWTAFSTVNASTACSISSSTVTTYKNLGNDKHYKNTSLSILADDGWYIQGSGLAKQWVQITAGVEVATDSCSGPI